MKLPPLRPGYRATDDLVERRARMAADWKKAPLEPGISAYEAAFGEVASLVAEPAHPAGTLLYFHGGGYRMGSPAGWTSFASRLAAASSLRVVVADYRLAPEHPFPAAVHDAVASFDALGATYGGSVFVGGDSAGGGLACALALAADRKPAGLILISPWLDLAVTNPTYDNRPADQLFPKASAQSAAELYLQGHPADHPLASPLLGDFTNFPPTLIFASSDEGVIGDTLDLQTKLADARVAVESHIVPGMTHVWPVIAPALPESQAALAAISAFTRRLISSS